MLVKLAFVMQRLKKYLKKFFVMINKDGGGQFLDFMGGHRAHGGSPSPPLGKTLVCHSKLWALICRLQVFTACEMLGNLKKSEIWETLDLWDCSLIRIYLNLSPLYSNGEGPNKIKILTL